jgi:type III pantothenate kinase
MTGGSAPIPAERVVVDIGNSRIKWGLIGADDQLVDTWSTELGIEDQVADWLRKLELREVTSRTRWAISSVNPPVARELETPLSRLAVEPPKWYRNAADVPVQSRLVNPTSAGADRAFNALAAGALAPEGVPGLVISCGTALTIEKIDRSRIWEGGAIAPGLDLAARSLAAGTAQIPRIIPHSGRPACGRTTEDAVGGGVFWGTVGAVKELIARQETQGWHLWTGGNASTIALEIEPGSTAPWIVNHLVLRGLAKAAFGASASAIAR